MEHQRPHLDRAHGDIEHGVADVLEERKQSHAAPHGAPPKWLVQWETSRPVWLMECLAEFLGVFLYVFAGIGASASFYVTAAAGAEGFGSLLNIGLSYGAGIAFAILEYATSYTDILAQILGGLVATLFVYLQYKQPLDEIYHALVAGGKEAAVFTTTGPAGVLALFPQPTQAKDLRYVFVNEFMCNLLLAVVVFCVLDPSNFFIQPALAPWIIGTGYAVIIWGFASQSIALNLARDLGGRLACAAVFDGRCFTHYPKYTALAALTTFPSTLLGAMIQTLFLGDTDRVLVNIPPELKEHHALQGGAPMSLRELTRENDGEVTDREDKTTISEGRRESISEH
ncbi:hypothetical protein T439DRAFT_351843 [Meredithblackwellia eburnea MCA 4105]